jgi:hypothetical protein
MRERERERERERDKEGARERIYTVDGDVSSWTCLN